MTDKERAENLVLLIEECGEVIQAATKALRFGWKHSWPDYENGAPNSQSVTKEIGNVLACVDRLELDIVDIEYFRIQKHRKLKTYGPEGKIGNPMF